MKAKVKFTSALDLSFEKIIEDEKNSIVSVESMGYVMESSYTLDELKTLYTDWSFQNSHINPREEKVTLTQKRIEEADTDNDRDLD